MSPLSFNGFSSLILLEAHWDMKFLLFLWACYQCLVSSLQILPCYFCSLVWTCTAEKRHMALVWAPSGCWWITHQCRALCRMMFGALHHSGQVLRSTGSLTRLISPKPFTSMAPPAPKSTRQDSNILQPVKVPRVSVHLSNAWVVFKFIKWNSPADPRK